MDVWSSLWGMMEVELTSASPMEALQHINHRGIEVFDARPVDALTVHFVLRRADWKAVRKIITARGENLRFLRKKGMYWSVKRLAKRLVLLAGIAFIVGMTLYLPSRILFVQVEGNNDIPSMQIIEKAADCGIFFGAKREDIRSEKVKNALLQAVPELQWAGVNTYGCRAVITVRERINGAPQNTDNRISSIVADRDGIVHEIIVKSGNRIVRPGQAVKAGQVLISGYTDCGICIRATRSEGEVYAQTNRKLSAVLPLDYEQKGNVLRQEKKYSLLIGKKQINFYKGSGISPISCDKMYVVDYITLPGGFQLPLAVVTQTVTYYDTATVTLNQKFAEDQITKYAEHYLTGAMIAGEIQERKLTVKQDRGFCVLDGTYSCVEMIGKTLFEESLEDYGQTDRT